MISFDGIIDNIKNYLPFFRTLIIIIFVYIVLNTILKLIEKRLLKTAKTKHHRSNIEIFSRIFKYLTVLLLTLFAIFSYSGSFTGLGLTVGLLSAALGWALQKPITGMAAWIMVVIRRPFEIGDRVIIGSIRGDVIDMTLTHIYLEEVGGLVPSEENSGRIVMVPNSLLFEQHVVNYTLQDEYVLDQVITLVTYESNLDKAMKTVLESAKKYTQEFTKDIKQQPYIRTFFQPSGINIHVRYFVPAFRVQEISSKITQEIFSRIKKAKDVEIAYPHTQIIYRKKRT